MLSQRLIACGMYAITPTMSDHWRTLFMPLAKLLGESVDSYCISMQTDDAVYRDPNLLLGQTCGYPYWLKWRRTHRPVFVPIFNITGCRDIDYSTWLICHRDRHIDSLADVKGGTIAINTECSNSGRLLLQQALLPFAENGLFEAKELMSGSHLSSIEAIANKKADLASIDVISWHFIKQQYPDLCRLVKAIDQSEYSPGLPFIAHQHLPIDNERLINAVKACLKNNPAIAEQLSITSFVPVNDSDYQRIGQKDALLKAAAFRFSA